MRIDITESGRRVRLDITPEGVRVRVRKVEPSGDTTTSATHGLIPSVFAVPGGGMVVARGGGAGGFSNSGAGGSVSVGGRPAGPPWGECPVCLRRHDPVEHAGGAGS